MAQATTSVGFIGFGFRDIGVGGIITESGSTGITHRDKFLLRLNFGPDIRGNLRPNLRTGSTSHGRHVLFLEQIKIQLLRKNLKALSDSATQYYRSQIFFLGPETKAIAVISYSRSVVDYFAINLTKRSRGHKEKPSC